jgi:hypothetical protein
VSRTYQAEAGRSPAGVLPPGTALLIPLAAFDRAFSLRRGDAARGPVPVSLFVVDMLDFGLSTFNFGLVPCPNSLAW